MIANHAGLVLKVGRQTPLAERPVSWTLTQPFMTRLLWPLVSLFWLTMSLNLAQDMWVHGETWGLLMPAAFLAIGISLFLFCVRGAVWRRRETIGTDTVSVDEWDTAGRRAWSEPLAHYRGIARVEVVLDRDSMFGSITVLVLDHERPDRRIVLWSDRMSRDLKRWREGYANWLGLPAVEALPWVNPAKVADGATVSRA